MRFLHFMRETLRHNGLCVVGGIDADNIQQIGWAHWPIELLLYQLSI
ncbi:MAG: hypothetical protein ACSLEN_04980 [Candidatus Malihini olakiniferum]